MKKEIRIGRHSKNDIVINDPCVGRSVLAITVDDDGESYAVDLKSKNGVYINNKRIYGRVKLYPDDVVRIGNTTLPWKEYIKGTQNMNYEFRQCVNGHDHQEDECPYEVKKAIKMMIDNENNQEQVREYLINTCNFDIESADTLISDISNWCEQYKKANSSANRNLVLGFFFFFCGSMVTAVTYVEAVSCGGGSYFIACGAIIYGLLQFIGGLVTKNQVVRSRKKLI